MSSNDSEFSEVNLSEIDERDEASEKSTSKKPDTFIDKSEKPLKISLPKPPKKPLSLNEIEQRFYAHLKKVSQKIDEMAKSKSQQELSQCSFKPKTNYNGQKRTFKEFLQDQSTYQARKQSKLKEMQLRTQDSESHSYKPSICKRSLNIPKSPEGVHTKLYNMFRQQKRTKMTKLIQQMDQNSFSPQINQRSKSIHRGAPIEVILYKDAQRRLNPPKNQTPQEPQKAKKKLTFKIESILTVDQKNNIQSIGFDKFSEVLSEMKFIENNSQAKEAWEYLVKPSKDFIPKKRLINFVYRVINEPTNDTMKKFCSNRKEALTPKVEEVKHPYVSMTQMTKRLKSPPKTFHLKSKKSPKTSEDLSNWIKDFPHLEQLTSQLVKSNLATQPLPPQEPISKHIKKIKHRKTKQATTQKKLIHLEKPDWCPLDLSDAETVDSEYLVVSVTLPNQQKHKFRVYEGTEAQNIYEFGMKHQLGEDCMKLIAAEVLKAPKYS